MATIICDLGGVYFTDGTRLAARKLAQKYSLDENQVYEVLDGTLGTQYRENEISLEEFWRRAKEDLSLSEDAHSLNQLWLGCYQKVPEVASFLQELRKQHRLFFLSDNVQERVDYLEQKYSFLQDFDDGVFSHEVGVRKPHKKIYLAALKKAGAKPEDCIYIDNKKELLAPAESIGMRTVHFQNPEQFKEDLTRLLHEE